MAEKIVVAPYSGSGNNYDHLYPIVNFLLGQGHKPINNFLWANNRTGFFCHLTGDIDFPTLRENFVLPNSIKLDELKQTVDCLDTYSIIKGGF